MKRKEKTEWKRMKKKGKENMERQRMEKNERKRKKKERNICKIKGKENKMDESNKLTCRFEALIRVYFKIKPILEIKKNHLYLALI